MVLTLRWSLEQNMTDGYLRGAVSQYKASKRSFLAGTKPIWGP